MKIPTVEEVRSYCEERGNGINPELWHDYYEACGWVIGKSRKPMKNWQAAVRTWERNSPKKDIVSRFSNTDWAQDLLTQH